MKSNQSRRGFILLVTAFVFLVVSLLVLSFLKIMAYRTNSDALTSGHIKAYYAAKAGVEDALYELKQGNAWPTGSVDLQWQSGGGNTLQKSTVAPVNPLTHFDYAVTYSVTVAYESGSSGTINIISQSMVENTFSSQISAKAVRTDSGKMIVLEMKEE